MASVEKVKEKVSELLNEYTRLASREIESERRVEEYVLEVFEALGWKRRSIEVIPQKRVKRGMSTTRVDYSLKRDGDLRASFYVEVKRFSDKLGDPKHVKQALDYGKNSSTRWVVLTNFVKWRVFNSDYFDQPEHAELFEFNLQDILPDNERLSWLLLFSRENGPAALDKYAKEHKKWKESADIKELLTEQLLEGRRTLSKVIFEQNKMKFDTGQDAAETVDECVQHIFDRIIFCRMLEDNSIDPDLRVSNVLEEWENGDKRIQFYRDFLCPFFLKMHAKYDSTIFDQERIDRLSIKNEDFVPIFKQFYTHPSGLHYDFSAIGVDVLGHTYENYLSYRVKKTEKRTDVVEGIFDRKQSGIYYTPEFLVDHLVRSTLGEKLKNCKTIHDALKIRIIDPACGSGTFLVRAYEEFRTWFIGYTHKNGGSESLSQMRLREDGESETASFLDRVLENCIYGIDKDPRATRLARLNLFLRAAENPKKLPELKIIERDSLVWDKDLKESFIFERDFPLIHEDGGFDVVLGNPPWEKWKPDSQEFFEEQDPGFKSLPTKEAKKRIRELFKKRPYLKKEWTEKLTEYEYYSTYYREHYEWQSAEGKNGGKSGDLDLYKIFTERAYQLAKPGGMVGFVVPSGIYTDLGAKGLRTMLFENCEITGMYGFENRKFVFPDIDQRYKFVLLSYKKGGKTISFPCAFFLHTKDDLDKAVEKPTILTVDFIKKSSPTSWSVLEIKSQKDKEIVERLLVNPFLGTKIEGKWNIELQSGFHMTNDNHLFRESALGGVPLLEGKNIHQFTHQWKEAPVARYHVSLEDLKANELDYHERYWFGFRRIARSTDVRTLICTIVPPGYCCSESITYIKNKLEFKTMCYLCGVINSFVLDYFIRQKVSANINMFYFLELPVPRLDSGPEYEAISKMTAQLVAVSDEFDELKKEFGIKYGVTDEKDRETIRARLEVAVAKLYGITKEELQYILTKFPIVDEKYKKKVLEEYI